MRDINRAYSIEKVDFQTAVLTGLGRNQGLYFPEKIPKLEDIDTLLAQNFVERSSNILQLLIGDNLSTTQLRRLISTAFNFPLELKKVTDSVYALELFHGPSLAFKDFGARFLAQCLKTFADNQAMTILTATSGDTGAAVAHAFYGLSNVRVVILYPKGRISPLQEKLFCTLGENIHTLAIESDFDACQALVKQAFADPALRKPLALNSANSINVARLLAQVCYYFEAVARFREHSGGSASPVITVPSGNFGNITAGLIARAMGLPIKRLVAATNENDTVPRFLESGQWDPQATVATMTNAMDVARPNNFPRVLKLAQDHAQEFNGAIYARQVSELATRSGIEQLYSHGYLADPHSALAWSALVADMSDESDSQQAAYLANLEGLETSEVE